MSSHFVFGPAHGTGPYVSRSKAPLVLWPSWLAWISILRGASAKAGLDDQHTIVCHLAAKVARRDELPMDVARDVVNSRIAGHVDQLLVEFGCDDPYAAAIADRVYWWLSTFDDDEQYHAHPSWPSPEQWLGIDRGAAGHADLDTRFTLSTQFAQYVARQRGVSPVGAKHWVHARIAHHASQLLRELGVGHFAASVVKGRIFRWLESFDRT